MYRVRVKEVALVGKALSFLCWQLKFIIYFYCRFFVSVWAAEVRRKTFQEDTSYVLFYEWKFILLRC